MKQPSLRTQLGAIFLGFLLLVVCSVAVTFWLVQTQQNDAAIINLAGRQRMLLQQMVRLALTEPEAAELEETIERFEQTLAVLRQGGEAMAGNGRILTLSPATNPTIQAHLQEIASQWLSFQNHLQPPVDSAQLQSDFGTLLIQLDEAVSAYEAEAQAKINRLRWVQVIFLAAAFLLLAWGYRLVHHQLLQPLTVLGEAAQAIGTDERDKEVPILRGRELNQLGQTMERMRTEIAASHTSLEKQVAQRTQELTTAFAFSQEIVRELEPAQLLQSVAHHTRELMQGDAVSVCVLASDGRTLELVAGSGVEDHHIGLRQSTTRGVALPVIQEHKTVIADGGCADCCFLHHYPDASCTASPMQIGGRSLGALCVVRSQPAFTDDEARALALLSNAAAVALENARLIAAGKQQAEENASLAERERLAANLHDNLAQNLGAMHLCVDQLANELAAGESSRAQQRLAEMRRNVRQAYAQVRLALTGLRDTAVNDDEFFTAVHSLTAEFAAETGLIVQLIAEDEEIWVTAVVQKQALHILREALTNIRRHAQARLVQLAISQNAHALTVEISDDGIGFVPEQVNSQNHLGLTIMRMRAERSQGTFTVCSAPGQGTRVTAVFPTKPAAEQTLEYAS